jgi:hypothetical protein
MSTLLDKIETLQALASKTKTIFTSLKKKIPKKVLTMLTKREVQTIEEEQGATILSLLNYINQVRSALDILEEDYEDFFDNADSHFEASNTENKMEGGKVKKEEMKIENVKRTEEIVKEQSYGNTEVKDTFKFDN